MSAVTLTRGAWLTAKPPLVQPAQTASSLPSPAPVGEGGAPQASRVVRR